MNIPKQRCEECHQWFRPYVRKVGIQKTCSRKQCQKARRTRQNRAHWKEHPVAYKDRRIKVLRWARRKKYWKRYRKKNKTYRKRDNTRRKKAHRAAKQYSLSQFSLDKLKSLRELKVSSAAKQYSLDPRVDGVLDYLVEKEHAAKQYAYTRPSV